MKEITAYAVRIAGLILIVTTLVKFPMTIYAYNSQLDNSIMIYFAPLFIPLFVGGVFFKFPSAFSDKFINLNNSELNVLKIDQYFYLGTILVGFILFFYSLSDIVFHVSNYIFLKNITEAEITILNYDFPAAIATAIELIFACLLILKSKAIVSFVNNANNK